METSEQDSSPIETYQFTVDVANYYYTSDRHAVTIGAYTYEPINGLARSNLSILAFNKESLSVELPLSNEVARLVGITKTPRVVKLKFRRYQRNNLSTPTMSFDGDMETFSLSGLKAILKFPNVFQAALATQLPKLTVQPNCNWRLGDKNCKKNVAPYKIIIPYSRTSLSNDGMQLRIIADSIYSGPEYSIALWKNGVLKATTDSFVEKRSIVASFNLSGQSATLLDTIPNGTIRLISPLTVYKPNTVFELTPGCDNTWSQCASESFWNNGANFGGFRWVPTEKGNPFQIRMDQKRFK